MNNFLVLAGGFDPMIIVYIIVFLLALAILITIHELGHLIVAKIFKVYCTDFSIGFGPKIIKIKRKKGETYFSIGVFPFGGYVSMVSDPEDEGLQELNIPKERTLGGIKRWKRICIMLAGVTMNFILAYVLFFVSVSCFPQIKVTPWYVVDNEVAQKYVTPDNESVGFYSNDEFIISELAKDGDTVRRFDSSKDDPRLVETYWLLSSESFKSSDANDKNEYVLVLDHYFKNGIKNLDLSTAAKIYVANPTRTDATHFANYPAVIDGKFKEYELKNGDEFNVSVKYYSAENHETKYDGTENTMITYIKEGEKPQIFTGNFRLKVTDGSFETVGVSFYKFEMWYGWRSFQVAGENWVEYSQLIGTTLGSLFIGRNWDSLGGPIAMYTQTTQILQNNPFYMYIMIWGVVSINLGIVNLLPFPGLDGWQVLTEIIEGSVNGIKKLKSKRAKKKELSKSGVRVEELTEQDVTTNKDTIMTIGEAKEKKEWKIPPKVKTIVSYVGLGLLLAFSVFILVRDVIHLF